jgi:hypothetical protein
MKIIQTKQYQLSCNKPTFTTIYNLGIMLTEFALAQNKYFE